MKQISHLAFRESSSSSTTGTSDKHKHNWIAAVCLPIRESVCYVLSSYRLQMVDEEMARIRVNCSPNTYKRSTRGWKTWIQTQESSLFHCHMCWVILSCCWDKRTEKREEQTQSPGVTRSLESGCFPLCQKVTSSKFKTNKQKTPELGKFWHQKICKKCARIWKMSLLIKNGSTMYLTWVCRISSWPKRLSTRLIVQSRHLNISHRMKET